MAFSPDGRFFIAVPVVRDSSGFAWHIGRNTTVRLRGGLRRFRDEASFDTPSFAFVGSNRIVIAPHWLERMVESATLVAFPSGKLIAKRKIALAAAL